MKEPMIGRDPKICFGAYRLKKHRIPIESLKSRYRAGESIPSLMKDYRISRQEVIAALQFKLKRPFWLLPLIFILFSIPAFAAFPVVASITESTGDDSDHIDVSLPATIGADELLLMFESATNDTIGGTITPSGWTLIFEDDDGDNSRFHLFAKHAVGNEDGSTVTITYGSIHVFSAAQVYQIQGWDGGILTSVIEAADSFSGVANDPPSLNPTNWGQEQTLWIEFATEDINDMTASSCSTNYTNGVKTRDDIRAQILTCRRNNNVVAEDPDSFGDVIAGRQFGATIAVRHGTAGSCPTITLNDTLTDGTLSYNTSGTTVASGGNEPYTYAVTAGTLPDGTTLDSDGNYSGIPAVANTFNFTVTATDEDGCTGDGIYQVIIDTATPGTAMKTGIWQVRQGNIWE